MNSLPELQKADHDRPVIAFFDMDLTLLKVNSARLWLSFAREQGRISLQTMLQGFFWMARYRLGTVDMQRVTEYALALEAGTSEEEMVEVCERWFERLVRPTLSARAVARVQAHQAAGHDVVILTASTRYGSTPLAQLLGLPLVCTELEVENGILTGRHLPPLCFGPGKLERARTFAGQHGALLGDSWFYTDSHTDLPVMEAVGHPVAVNADRWLRRRARERGWPRVDWVGTSR